MMGVGKTNMSDKKHEELKRALKALRVDVDLANKTAEARRLVAKREKELEKTIEITGDETVPISVAEPHRLQLPICDQVVGTTDGDETQPFVDTPTTQDNYESWFRGALRSIDDIKSASQAIAAGDTKAKKRKHIETESEVNKPSAYTKYASFRYAGQNESSLVSATKGIKRTDESTEIDETRTDKCIIN
jgi:hypothetical protein